MSTNKKFLAESGLEIVIRYSSEYQLQRDKAGWWFIWNPNAQQDLTPITAEDALKRLKTYQERMTQGIKSHQAELDYMKVGLKIAERHLANPNPAVF